MAFVDDIGVLKLGICVSKAGPSGAVTELRLCDAPKSVAVANRIFCWCSWRSERNGHDNLRAHLEQVWIAKPRIERKQFMPSVSIAEARGGELPERVPRLDGDHSELARDFQ